MPIFRLLFFMLPKQLLLSLLGINFALPFFPTVTVRWRIFRLPNFLVAVFFQWPFSVFVILHHNFVLPFFPTISIFVAHFSCCRFFLLPLFHTSILCCPVFLPSNFSLPIILVAQFSSCRFYHCCFFTCPFYRCSFCSESFSGLDILHVDS